MSDELLKFTLEFSPPQLEKNTKHQENCIKQLMNAPQLFISALGLARVIKGSRFAKKACQKLQQAMFKILKFENLVRLRQLFFQLKRPN